MEKEKFVYKHNNKTYQQKINELYDNQFTLLGDYINAKSSVKLKCNHCNYEFTISCSALEKNNIEEKCPNCRIKKREQEIKNIVESKHKNVKVIDVKYVSNEKYDVTFLCEIHKTTYTRSSKGIMHKNNLICGECIKEHRLKDKIKHAKDKFPVELKNGYILNFLNYHVKDDLILISCIDQYGYKYQFDTKTFSSIQGYSSNPCRFFKRNPYTYENINLYCKQNNIDLFIDGTNLPTADCARELLDFVDSKGNIIKTSWNHISKYKIKCKTQDEVINIKNRLYMSKEQAIPIIKRKEKEVGRPLLQSDFEGVQTTNTSIGIRVIWRLWGTFNNMIDELGLIKHDYFYKPNDKNYVPHEDIMLMIKDVCEKIKCTGRDIIMYSDFEDNTGLDITKIRRHCALEDTTLNDVVKLYGCKLQSSGNGMNYIFSDGEKTVSKYEYDFSIFLRENGFEYNKTYYRNIYYKNLDNEYAGNMNCDYCIDFSGNLVYIELAGILGNKKYQNAYRNNTPINSKSKELYRQSLNRKREIFEKNNLNYYILLPDEMNVENYKNIIEYEMSKAA